MLRRVSSPTSRQLALENYFERKAAFGTMPRAEVDRLLASLWEDRYIWARAPCGHEYRLVDGSLFYGSQIPPVGQEYVKALREDLKGLNQEIKRLLTRLTSGFTKKSVEVKLGKTVEKVIPALPGFPLDRGDCRSIFDPIDYLAFVGLSQGCVSKLEFIDVKTGNARLSRVQKAIKEVVEDGRVTMREAGG